jgi:hypothetical protein
MGPWHWPTQKESLWSWFKGSKTNSMINYTCQYQYDHYSFKDTQMWMILWLSFLLINASQSMAHSMCLRNICWIKKWKYAIIVRGAQIAFLKSTDCLLGPTNSLKTGKAWHLCLHFVSVFALSRSLISYFTNILHSRKDKTDNIFMTMNWNHLQLPSSQ